MLRSSLALWAPVARSAGAAPFARALLTGRVSEARVDAYFFDQSRSADADASPYLNRRDARVAALREAYGLGDGGKNAAAMARPVAKDLRPFSASAAGDAAEASAALTLILDALVQHSKSTAEFGKWLADTEAMQQVLSRLASSIFALDAAAMAVDAAKDVAPEAHEGESALLAVVARRILERRVGDAVSVMNPSCVFAPDAAPSMPARFQAVQHVAAGFKTLSGANAHPLEAAAISALVADAAQAATAAPGPNSMIGAVRGNRAFYEERAAREFPVNMYLKLNAVQLCDDVCAFRNAVVDSRAKVLLGDKANAAATGAVAAICSELFECRRGRDGRVPGGAQGAGVPGGVAPRAHR